MRESWEKSWTGAVLDTTASLLACGVRPDRVTLFQQSRVPEHLQLAWLCNSFCSVQKLQRLTQYKVPPLKVRPNAHRSERGRAQDKARALGATAGTPAGLLIYPILQAADILLYKATHVPVGADQEQHFQVRLGIHLRDTGDLNLLQVVRDVAKAANGLLRSDLFPIPKAVVASAAPRLRSLRSATAKMSKSDPDPNSCLNIADPPDLIRRKLRKVPSHGTPLKGPIIFT